MAQRVTSATTATLSSSDAPGHGSFITVSSSPYDWRSPQNHSLWQGASGNNNPCPAGFRLPTAAEWATEQASWSSQNAAGAFASPLKLVMTGYRRSYNGMLSAVGDSGSYWSNTVTGIYSLYLQFGASTTYIPSATRADGQSIRCLKD